MFLRPLRIIKRSKYLTSKFPDRKWKIRNLGNPILNDIRMITSLDQNPKSFVIKKYGSIFSIAKWLVVKASTISGSNYSVNSTHRQQNEINGLTWIKLHGFDSPVFYEKVDSTIIIDYIKGIPIDQYSRFTVEEFFQHFKALGKILANIHIQGAVLGDCKAENILYSTQEKKYYILDVEQFSQIRKNEIKKRVWDFTELFFYLGHFFPLKQRFPFLRHLILTFLSSYFKTIRKSSLDKNIKMKLWQELGNWKYTLVYVFFMNPFTFCFIKSIIQEFKTKKCFKP